MREGWKNKINIPKDLLDPQPQTMLFQRKTSAKLRGKRRQSRTSRHDESSRNQTHIIGHLFDIFHLLFLHGVERLLGRLFYACLARCEGFALADAGECARCVAEEALLSRAWLREVGCEEC
jgi:hypothetical protein